jgi:hypothetical protein
MWEVAKYSVALASDAAGSRQPSEIFK